MKKKLFIILVSVCAISAVFLIFFGTKYYSGAITAMQRQSEIASAVENFPQVVGSAKPETSEIAGNVSAPAAVESENYNAVNSDAKKIQVSFVAEKFSYSGEMSASSTVYDLMEKLASTTDFTFKSQYYSGIGYFVREINNVPNSGGKYWTLYVNGKYSNVGASQYELQSGDSVEWKYEKL
ncbi:MAG: DUF4430 domain-containing protein [Candidatus Liptonbacteria bacterium]|nr:DUF4430 domain-containing protein [Candidatus Liptonbacteria bacterium]